MHLLHVEAAFASPSEDESASVDPLKIWGFVGAPGLSRSTRQDQHLFVNRRPVENRGLNFALLEGYHTALMKGRYPVACLFIEIDPAEVDVNVHPAKREVRFRQEHAVRSAVAGAVRQALLDYHRQTAPPAVLAAPTAPSRQHTALPNPPLLPGQPSPTRTKTSTVQPAVEPPLPGLARALFRLTAATSPVEPTPPATTPPNRITVETAIPQPHAATGNPPAPEADALPAPAPLLQVPLRLLGVVGQLYVLFESDRGLVLMDQHAAHERVLFEQMLKRLEQGPAPSQRLLLPETVELSVRDAEFVRDQIEILVRLGVGLSEFGDRTFLLDALPPFVRAGDPRQFVRDLLDELKAAGREINHLRLGEHTVAKTVCRHAVKAHDPLSPPELEQLVEDLRACAMPYTCPHGRPTLIEINLRELDRKFGRSQ